MAPSPLSAIRKFQRVSDTLASAGEPTPEQFALIRDAGFHAVVNLLPIERAAPNEAQTVRDLGMAYVHIPVVWASPQLSDVRQFFDTMDALAGQRVLVHCAVNMRASAFVYLYRIMRLGVHPDEAEDDLHDVWIPEGVWADLIAHVLGNEAAAKAH